MRKPDKPYVPEPGMTHESGDISLKPILRGLFWFFAFTVVSAIVTAGIYLLLVPHGFAPAVAQDSLHRRLPPEPLPRLQGNVSVKKAIADMRAVEYEALTTPVWLDREKGIVRLPIERAIQLTERRGLPQWPTPKAGDSRINRGEGGVQR